MCIRDRGRPGAVASAFDKLSGVLRLLMGHGQQEGRCDMVLSDFARELTDRDSLAFFATVEGTRGVAPILEQLKKSGAKTCLLYTSLHGFSQFTRYMPDLESGMDVTAVKNCSS